MPFTSQSLPVVPTTIAPAPHVGGTVNLPAVDQRPPMQVTLLQVIDPAQGADQFAVPLSGDRFVALQLRVAQGGTTTLTESMPTDTTVLDANGNLFTASNANVQGCTAFGSFVNLKPGRPKTGCLTFELATGSSVATVLFTPNNQFGSVSAAWQVP